ncbi:hypothetical protein [Neorhizobium sp. LjRoot104]|uniref:hypothetical protein n=1 Tax=Neorhizobium sp. LjRoot104 TaxID=3342254 RepID=UPI003ED141B3
MPHLISYIITRLAAGFVIGAATASAIIIGPLGAHELSYQHLATWLTVYGIGSSFALGYLATSLAFEAEG